MTVRYAVITERYGHVNGSRDCYGLAAYADGNCEESPVAVIHDITTDQQALVHLAETCNRLQLSILHIRDIVEDFLAE